MAQVATTSAAPATPPTWTIPDARTWAWGDLGRHRMRIFPGAKVTERGSNVEVRMPGGYGLSFYTPSDASIDTAKEKYRKGEYYGSLAIVFEAEDAIIARRVEAGALGTYCEVSVAKSGNGWRFALTYEGAKVLSKTNIERLSSEECAGLVAMVRSVEPK